MRYTQLHTKSQKTAREYESVNATLLIKAGYISQVLAGVYAFLPLGLRVLNKIEQIVREEMDNIGSELLLSSLAPQENWQKTDRLETVDVLFKATGANAASRKRNDQEYVLNSTHEELITPIAAQFASSYKDLPAAYYQIQTKFRNEPRAKSGLLRGREFRMKDLYSFHANEEDFSRYYEEAKKAYTQVFKRVGLGEHTVIALASGGDFTDQFSHEFQTICETGEDTLFYDEVDDIYYNREVAPSKAITPDQEKEQKEMEEVYGENITGMDALVKFLNIPAEKCVKTLIYQGNQDVILAVAIRGDYDVNEHKLRQATGCTGLRLADEETVNQVTGATLGYAGIVNLPNTVRLIADDSIAELVNFECGANKSNVHLINVNWDRDVQRPESFVDVKIAKEGDLNPKTDAPMRSVKAAEVGNIFPLADKFSKAFQYTYTDRDGSEQPVLMGCYGIGTSRLMGVIAELFHDDRGLIWPTSVTPYQVSLVSLADVEEQAHTIYSKLQQAGIEVLWDDRSVSAGEKFSDVDLMGIPVRLVVSTKTGDKVEWKERSSANTELMDVEAAITRLRGLYSQNVQ